MWEVIWGSHWQCWCHRYIVGFILTFLYWPSKHEFICTDFLRLSCFHLVFACVRSSADAQAFTLKTNRRLWNTSYWRKSLQRCLISKRRCIVLSSLLRSSDVCRQLIQRLHPKPECGHIPLWFSSLPGRNVTSSHLTPSHARRCFLTWTWPPQDEGRASPEQHVLFISAISVFFVTSTRLTMWIWNLSICTYKSNIRLLLLLNL